MRAPEKGGTGARRASLFRIGRSQAVRLPKEFRFEGSEVRIRRAGRAVILEPVGEGAWPPGYWENMPRLDRDWRRPRDALPPRGRRGQTESYRTTEDTENTECVQAALFLAEAG